MRIISGKDRGRKFDAPEGAQTRPISDRAKEGIFNMLINIIDLEGAVVLDLFAGSGSFGFECISRGAAHVNYVEKSRNAIKTLEDNIEKLGYKEQTSIHRKDVTASLVSQLEAGIVFCDPPYMDSPWPMLFSSIKSDIIVGHASSPIELGEGWRELRRRKYGRSHILICEKINN